jgi:hypothetical protein
MRFFGGVPSAEMVETGAAELLSLMVKEHRNTGQSAQGYYMGDEGPAGQSVIQTEREKESRSPHAGHALRATKERLVYVLRKLQVHPIAKWPQHHLRPERGPDSDVDEEIDE